jgi:Domain of unknown function (DUF4156)
VGRRWCVVVMGMCVGCSYAGLDAGRRVEVAKAHPACEELAPVEGRSGGAFGGWVSNDALREDATNDLRNRAAREGATDVWIGDPAYQTSLGAVTGVRVAGRAFRCAR